MHFSAKDISSDMAYKLLVSTILPRPIAFVTTVNSDGQPNGAPFSFFNAMGSDPPVIVLGFQPHDDGTQKDTPNNIISTSEFVVNIVDEPLADQMNICASIVPSDVDELELSKLKTIPSIGIAPPRIVDSPTSMECKYMHDILLDGGGRIIVGEVIHFHVCDELITGFDPFRIDINKRSPISRLNGAMYGRITDQFELKRPKKT